MAFEAARGPAETQGGQNGDEAFGDHRHSGRFASWNISIPVLADICKFSVLFVVELSLESQGVCRHGWRH